MLISKAKICLVVHHKIYASPQALRDYLMKKECASLLYIGHPLPVQAIKESQRSFHDYIENGREIIHKESKNRSASLLITTLYEIILTCKWVFQSKIKFDLYIGVDNLNALIGLILRMLGRVERVVYYTIDYFPTRFSNPILNRVYHAIDKICVRYADETWNISSQMIVARERYNRMDRKIFNRQHTVPIGVWFNKSKRQPFSKSNMYRMMFVGHLLAFHGVDLLIFSIPDILKKFPKVTLEIIGGGEEERNLKALVQKLKLTRKVKFYGWISDRAKVEKILAHGSIGFAPFNTEILDDKVKNADPAKLKDYMLLGMPVIVTDAIAHAKEISKSKSGIVIPYKKEAIVSAVDYLLSDINRLKSYRKNALSYIRKFDYDNIFAPHLERILNK